MAFSPRLPTFINFRTKGFQSHHKEDYVFNAHAHVAVELSVLAIKPVIISFILRHGAETQGYKVMPGGFLHVEEILQSKRI